MTKSFYVRREAEPVIEKWRIHYNTKRPHSSLGYRPPAPLTIAPKPIPLDERSNIPTLTKYQAGQGRPLPIEQQNFSCDAGIAKQFAGG